MEKVIWSKSDNFDTIHKKLLSLVGSKIIGTSNQELKVFSVGNVEEDYFANYLSSIVKFMEGDNKYVMGRGEFNFKDPDIIPQWSFIVEVGTEHENGCCSINPYKFTMPRTNDYNEDLKQCGYVYDPNHPFITYEKQPKKI